MSYTQYGHKPVYVCWGVRFDSRKAYKRWFKEYSGRREPPWSYVWDWSELMKPALWFWEV
jgi:hypothetical protein